MGLKNIFKMTKTDRYTQDGRDELAKLQETEDVKYKTGDISQKTGLQKQPDGSWAPPKKGGKPAAKKEAGSINRTPERIAKETAIMEALNLSTGEDNNLHKMSDETIERLYARTQEKPAAGKTTVRQGPNTKTLDEPPGEHIQKNLDAYRGYKPGDMEGLVLGPSGYKKQSSTKGPEGTSSITYTKEGEEDVVLFFDKYGELKNAGTSRDREGVMKKMQAAEGLGHMKVIGDYDVYRVTSGPDKGKYKVSKVGSLKEVTMSEQKAADFLSSAAVGNKSEKTKELMEKYKDLPGAQKKDALYVSTFEGSSIGMTQKSMESQGWDLVQADDDVNVYAKPDGSKVTMKHDGKTITSTEYEAPGSAESKAWADRSKNERTATLVDWLDDWDKHPEEKNDAAYAAIEKELASRGVNRAGRQDAKKADNAGRNEFYRRAYEGDAAPKIRQLTGDCRIRIRKEKPKLTGDTKIRIRK
jgi:hypothetical protein